MRYTFYMYFIWNVQVSYKDIACELYNFHIKILHDVGDSTQGMFQITFILWNLQLLYKDIENWLYNVHIETSDINYSYAIQKYIIYHHGAQGKNRSRAKEIIKKAIITCFVFLVHYI